MARQRSTNRDKAFEIHQKHKGNIDLLVEIAKQLSLSNGTVRGWKNKDKWDSKLNGTLQKNTERSNSKKNIINKEPMFEAVTEIDNPELTDKQRLFCIYYIKHFSATKAAIKAGYSKDTAYSIGSESLNKTEIKEEILESKRQTMSTMRT